MLLALPAHAALFDDDEARRAILDLRQQIQQMDQANAQQASEAAKTNAQLNEQLQVLKRSLLELNSQLEALRGEIARLRGTDEQLTRDLSELQRRQKDIAQGVDDRMRKLEPQKVSVDGREFLADPEEKRQFDDALAVLRNGDFDKAAASFGGFLRRYPASGYADSARFWLGNALYGKREYKEAITSFRSLVNNAPDHPRAPEALLAMANCQVEMKDTKAARATIDELIKATRSPKPRRPAANGWRR